MSSSTPLITCFIPAYNGAAFLPEAVASIQDQTLEDWECLIIDDCSTDGTWSYLRTIQDSRIILVRNPAQLNVATSSNVAQHLARGRYLARLDQDDIAMADRFEKQATFMEKHPEVAVCGGWMEMFGIQNGLAVAYETDPFIKANLLPAIGNIYNPASFVRLDFLRHHQIHSDPSYPLSCDYGMWVDCMLHNARFHNLQEPVTRYRVHANQGSRQTNEIRRGVRKARTWILHHWFPSLTSRQIAEVEPLLHVFGSVEMSPDNALAGLSVCEQLLADPQPSVHGEDRSHVYAFIRERKIVFEKLLETPRA
jgi:glycosyltransferase involved in cell wall biosynthesis